ncbi:hypothetical protein [Antrihabitans cavernicola]|uniref:Phage tail protein n=1 Tax=Antrihabitans cavernicola TaxID=2495913 RepID=A0A5A7S6N2_9NOCA|nr:hypothetical protein [Spelaeibacter cavernicola]KAA0021808.1 hypothetical protein FOY51_15500 [Spelaeibacter cavernicola]
MATDTSKVFVPAPPKVKGVIHRAELGTELPEDAATDLAVAYKDQGGVSDAGITNAQSRDVTKVKDFGGKTVATPQSDYSETLTVEFLESTNLETLKTVFGSDNVSFTAATPDKGAQIVVDHTAAALPKSVYVVDTAQGKGLRRQVVPIGQPTKVGDVVQVSKDVVKYNVTIECFEYVDGDKAFFVREYLYDGITAP